MIEKIFCIRRSDCWWMEGLQATLRSLHSSVVVASQSSFSTSCYIDRGRLVVCGQIKNQFVIQFWFMPNSINSNWLYTHTPNRLRAGSTTVASILRSTLSVAIFAEAAYTIYLYVHFNKTDQVVVQKCHLMLSGSGNGKVLYQNLTPSSQF